MATTATMDIQAIKQNLMETLEEDFEDDMDDIDENDLNDFLMNAKAKRGEEIVTKVEEKSEKKLDEEKNIKLADTTTEEKPKELEDEVKTMEDAEEEEEEGEKEEAESEGGAWVARGRGVVSPSGAQHSSRAAALQAAIDMGDKQGVTQVRLY